MNKLFLKIIALLIIPLGLTMLQGCYPNDSLTVEQTDVVATIYNDSVDFNTIKTYYMPDTVFVLGDEDDDKKKPIENPEVILDNIASNLAAYGYTRLFTEDDGEPDVVVMTGAFTSTTVTVGWWYPYYSGWWWKNGERDTDYWYPWYPGYYPPGYWPSYPVYSSYTTGTVIWDMHNPNDYDVVEGDTLSRIYWNAAIQGVLNGANPSTRIKNSIDQAFSQSPQIKTSK